MDSSTGQGGKQPHRSSTLPTGVWQLRRVGPPSTIQCSASLIRLKEDGEVTVGRGPAADYFVDSAITLRLISRIHASIIGHKQSNGIPKFTIVNNGLNGTYINDIKMGYHSENKQVLHEGDRVTFGHPGCASIQPGSYAPQQDSEFQFIFEFVPAPKSSLYEENIMKRSTVPCLENLKHNLLTEKTPEVNAVMELCESGHRPVVVNGSLGARLSDSPQSNASTSEKENDSLCVRDVKIMPSVSCENHGVILPVKDSASRTCLEKHLNHEMLVSDCKSVSKCGVNLDKKLTQTSPVRQSPLTVPSSNHESSKLQHVLNKDNTQKTQDYVVYRHHKEQPEVAFSDKFSPSFCCNGGGIQVNSTTIILGEECEDEDDADGQDSDCSSSSGDVDVQFIGATAAELPSCLTLGCEDLDPQGSSCAINNNHTTCCTSEKKNIEKKNVTSDLLPGNKLCSEKSQDSTLSVAKSASSTDSMDCYPLHLKDIVITKNSNSKFAEAVDLSLSQKMKSIVGPKDHRIISNKLLKIAASSMITKEDDAEISDDDLSGSDVSESASSCSETSSSHSASLDSISPPKLSPQAPLQKHKSVSSSTSSSSHSSVHSGSDSDSSHSRTQSTASSMANSKGKLSSTSGSSSHSNKVKSKRKDYFKDVVPLMYSSSDEGEVFVENRTKEIVKKIYTPHKKKDKKDTLSSKKSQQNPGLTEPIKLNIKMLSSDKRTMTPPLSPASSLSSLSSTSISSLSNSSKNNDLATKEMNKVHGTSPALSPSVSDTSDQESLSSTISKSLTKLDPLLDPQCYSQNTNKHLPKKNSSIQPKKNTGLMKRTEPLILKSSPSHSEKQKIVSTSVMDLYTKTSLSSLSSSSSSSSPSNIVLKFSPSPLEKQKIATATVKDTKSKNSLSSSSSSSSSSSHHLSNSNISSSKSSPQTSSHIPASKSAASKSPTVPVQSHQSVNKSSSSTSSSSHSSGKSSKSSPETSPPHKSLHQLTSLKPSTQPGSLSSTKDKSHEPRPAQVRDTGTGVKSSNLVKAPQQVKSSNTVIKTTKVGDLKNTESLSLKGKGQKATPVKQLSSVKNSSPVKQSSHVKQTSPVKQSSLVKQTSPPHHLKTKLAEPLPAKKNAPSEAGKEMSKGSPGKSEKERKTVADNSSQKLTAKTISLPSKKPPRDSEKHSMPKKEMAQNYFASQLNAETKLTPKPKEESSPEKSLKFPQSKLTLSKDAVSSPAPTIVGISSSLTSITESQKKISQVNKPKPLFSTLDDSAFMKDLENSVSIKKKLTRGKPVTKAAAKGDSVKSGGLTAAKDKKSIPPNSMGKEEKVSVGNKQSQMPADKTGGRKRKLSSDDEDSMDVPSLKRSTRAKPQSNFKESLGSNRLKRVMTRTGSVSSTSSSTKTRRASVKKGKGNQGNKKRRKKIVSDTTSEEDLDDDDYSEEEENDGNEDWNLPEGVQYYDNLCSAAKCLNPVGSKLDWVMCDNCEQWYHVVCVDCPVEVIQNENVKFHCGLC